MPRNFTFHSTGSRLSVGVSNAAKSNPFVSSSGNTVVYFYEREQNLYGQTRQFGSATFSLPFRLNPLNASQTYSHPQAASDDRNVFTAWQERGPTPAFLTQLVGRLFSNTGIPQSPPLSISQTPSKTPGPHRLLWTPDSIISTWQQHPPAGQPQILLRTIELNGTSKNPELTVNNNCQPGELAITQLNKQVALIAFYRNVNAIQQLIVQPIFNNGSLYQQPTLIRNNSASDYSSSLRATYVNNNRVLFTWTLQTSNTVSVRGQFYQPNFPVQPSFPLSSLNNWQQQFDPSVSPYNDSMVATWVGIEKDGDNGGTIHGSIIAPGGAPGETTALYTNPNTIPQHLKTVVTADSGFTVVWSEQPIGANQTLWSQDFRIGPTSPHANSAPQETADESDVLIFSLLSSFVLLLLLSIFCFKRRCNDERHEGQKSCYDVSLFSGANQQNDFPLGERNQLQP